MDPVRTLRSSLRLHHPRRVRFLLLFLEDSVSDVDSEEEDDGFEEGEEGCKAESQAHRLKRTSMGDHWAAKYGMGVMVTPPY
jgi:hypothetical protein